MKLKKKQLEHFFMGVIRVIITFTVNHFLFTILKLKISGNFSKHKIYTFTKEI
jgi:hypothetical protein